VEFITENLAFTGEDSPMATLLLSVMGAFAEFERALIRERQREGIAAAKQRGVYTGRRPALTAEQAHWLRERAAAGERKSALAGEFGISRETGWPDGTGRSGAGESPAGSAAGRSSGCRAAKNSSSRCGECPARSAAGPSVRSTGPGGAARRPGRRPPGAAAYGPPAWSWPPVPARPRRPRTGTAAPR